MIPERSITLDDLTDYLAGESTPDQAAQIVAWIAQDPTRQHALADMRRVWSMTVERTKPDVDLGTMFRAVEDRIQPKRPSRSHSLLRSRPSRAIGIVGVLSAMLLVIGLIGHRITNTNGEIRTFSTAPGQRSTIQLADGSSMMLGPATSAVVTDDGIEVTGEGYFHVTPSASRAIVVRTKNAAVRVLGTRFSVRQYANESATRVIVEDGKVALARVRDGRNEHDARSTVLTAAMSAFVTDSSIDTMHEIAVRDQIAWTHGRLVFTDVPLRDVIPELSRAYGAEIRVSDSTLSMQSISFATSVQDVPLSDVLDLLAFSINAHYTRTGSVYVISPGRPASRAPQSHQLRRFPQPEKSYGR